MPREEVSGAGSGVLPATECRTRTMAFTSAGWAGISLERKSRRRNHVHRAAKKSAARYQQRIYIRNGRAILAGCASSTSDIAFGCPPTNTSPQAEKLRLLHDPMLTLPLYTSVICSHGSNPPL